MSEEKILLEVRNRFAGQLHWIVPELESLFKNHGGTINGQSLRIGMNPRHGSEYTSCVIHGPIRELSHQMKIPPTYKALLQRFNGAKLFAFELFGLLDDQSNQRRCLSLQTANQIWMTGYKKLPSPSFHFGSRAFSYFENIGYFYNESGQVYCAKKSGEILNQWPSVEEMLRAEWNISKEIEIEMRERLSQPMQAS
jgi:hypothetical protein